MILMIMMMMIMMMVMISDNDDGDDRHNVDEEYLLFKRFDYKQQY